MNRSFDVRALDPSARSLDAALIADGFVAPVADGGVKPRQRPGVAMTMPAQASGSSTWEVAVRIAAGIHDAVGGGDRRPPSTGLLQVLLRRGCHGSPWAAALVATRFSRTMKRPCPVVTSTAMNVALRHRSMVVANAVFDDYQARCWSGALALTPALLEARLHCLRATYKWDAALRLAAKHPDMLTARARESVLSACAVAPTPTEEGHSCLPLRWFRHNPDARGHLLDALLGSTMRGRWEAGLSVFAAARAHAGHCESMQALQGFQVQRARLVTAVPDPDGAFDRRMWWRATLRDFLASPPEQRLQQGTSVLNLLDRMLERPLGRIYVADPDAKQLLAALSIAHRDRIKLPRYSTVTLPRQAAKMVAEAAAAPDEKPRRRLRVVVLDTNVVLRCLLFPEFEEQLHASTVADLDRRPAAGAREEPTSVHVVIPLPVVREVVHNVRFQRGGLVRFARRAAATESGKAANAASGAQEPLLARSPPSPTTAAEDEIVGAGEEDDADDAAGHGTEDFDVDDSSHVVAGTTPQARTHIAKPVLAHTRSKLWSRFTRLIVERRWTLASPTQHYGAVARSSAVERPRSRDTTRSTVATPPTRGDVNDLHIVLYTQALERAVSREAGKHPPARRVQTSVTLLSFDQEAVKRAAQHGVHAAVPYLPYGDTVPP